MQRELLAFSMMKQIGSVRIRALMKAVDEPAQIFGLRFNDLCRISGIGPQAAAEIRSFTEWDAVDRILKRTHECGYQLISILDKAYPARLAEIYDAPPLLWAHGELNILQKPSIAIVGTRTVGKYAQELTRYFSRELSNAGLVIVSGLAAGVDTLAHHECLLAGGETIAILGSGFNRVYPSANKFLARQIASKGGCLLSEYPPDQVAEAKFFPTRNRLVSGISLGVLMTESGIKGGSMITAARALDQNREVFAIPHPINKDKRGEGGNHLIRESAARLVTSPADILQEIGMQCEFNADFDMPNSSFTPKKWKKEEIRVHLNDLDVKILESCDQQSKNVDELLDILQVDLNVLQQCAFELEMQGLLEQKTGARYLAI